MSHRQPGPRPIAVGIDLGTTNSALAHVDRSGRVVTASIPQLVAPGEVIERPTLPSFLYLASQHELPPGALRLPWEDAAADPHQAVGEFARAQGALVPARLIASAKSWLCHPRVDRLRPILPWGDREESTPERRLSPVEASAAYLAHLAAAWRFGTGRDLAGEEVILCVPASFDEVARELTLKAAESVGLHPTLLEEPQAAFYSWLADHPDWQRHLQAGDSVLICDIGGGTTDFSLIAVRSAAGGTPELERTAVGDHLMLGGDNMDLALARRVEARLTRRGAGSGAALDPRSFQALVQACRTAKERLLGDEDRSSWTVTIATRGARLIGGTLRDEIARDELEELLVEGFFPRASVEAAPLSPAGARAGLQEFGLPYAADAAITRHLAAFLRAHQARPTVLLCNGGVLKAAPLRTRLVEVLAGWTGERPRLLDSAHPDLAVARGAAHYALARRGEAARISGGAARAYYLGIDTARVQPGAVTVLCLTGRGLEEGQDVELKQHELELITNRPVRFRLFSSSERAGDRPGELLDLPAGALHELEPIYTVLRFARSSQDLALAVHLKARLTEIGTLELECVARATGNEQSDRWKLHFDLRAAESSAAAPISASTAVAAGAAVAAESTVAAETAGSPAPAESAALERALTVVRAVFGSAEAAIAPAAAMKSLQAVLGPKESWPTATLRALWEPLRELRGGRGRSAAHEARWLNLCGYLLRPGVGYPLDDYRVKETWRIFNAGVVHDKDEPCQLEWWILWRRVSGGLTRTQQDELYKRIAPHFLPGFARRAERKPPSLQEAAEMWRTVASLERLGARQKTELGDVLMGHIERRKAPAHGLWALGRLGARVPLYGPAEEVVPRVQAERWLERLLALEWRGETHAAVAEIARASGDRARDLEPTLRRRLADQLARGPDGERLARVVLEPVARGEKEEQLAFGDSLPSGLRLIQPVSLDPESDQIGS